MSKIRRQSRHARMNVLARLARWYSGAFKALVQRRVTVNGPGPHIAIGDGLTAAEFARRASVLWGSSTTGNK